jgi:hypothetical protein
MCRGIVEKVMVLFHIFTVIALRAGQAKEALFEDRICLIPQAEREAQSALFVADAQQALFTPAVGTRTCMVMWERVPGVTIG